MTSAERRASEIAEMIRDAFGDVPYPGDSRLVCSSDLESREVAEAFGGKSAQEASDPGFLARHISGLNLFTPQAAHYYLQAYMLAELRRVQEDRDDDIGNTAIHHFVCRIQNATGTTEEYVDQYSPAQRSAILAFVAFYRDVINRDWHFVHAPEEDPVAIISQYWK